MYALKWQDELEPPAVLGLLLTCSAGMCSLGVGTMRLKIPGLGEFSECLSFHNSPSTFSLCTSSISRSCLLLSVAISLAHQAVVGFISLQHSVHK